MSDLENLPPETLAQILGNLSKADLARISRVSRHVGAMVEPILYRSPSLTETSNDTMKRPSLEGFAYTLLSADLVRGQVLRNHVHSLVVRWEIVANPFCWTRDHTSMNGSTWFHWFDPITAYHGIQCVLLLHLLPSLRTLKIHPPHDSFGFSSSYFTHCMDSPDFTYAHGFNVPSLREFCCSYEKGRGGVSAETVLKIMQLPLINRIDAHITSSKSFDSGECHNTSTLSQLRLSYLHNEAMSLSSSISFLIKVPIQLTHFSYTAVGKDNVNIAGFVHSLRPLRRSVQYLRLDLGIIEAGNNNRGASLKEWLVLRTLSCSLVALLGNGLQEHTPCLTDRLPPGLQGLEILEDRYWQCQIVVDQLVSLVGRKTLAVTALERVYGACLVNAGQGVREDQSARMELSRVCVANGVRLLGDNDSFVW